MVKCKNTHNMSRGMQRISATCAITKSLVNEAQEQCELVPFLIRFNRMQQQIL